MAELVRESGAHPHVAAPKPPQIVYGEHPNVVERAVLAAAEQAVDPIGRRMRKDGQVMVSGVASYPLRLARFTEKDWQAYLHWERDTIEWLRRQYGNRLRCVIRHTDETYVHIHWLVVPDLVAGERIEAVDPGKRAIARAKAEGLTSKRLLDQRYRSAMRGWQDDYWKAVGSKHRLQRSGPQRQRMTRSAWHSEREAADLAARLAKERDLLTIENTRLTAENGRLRGALDAVAQRARAIVRSLLQIGGEELGDDVPTWLDQSEWASVVRKVRAFAAVATLRAATRGIAPMRMVNRKAEQVR